MAIALRIVEYDQSVADKILDLLASGLTATRVVKMNAMFPTIRTIRAWRQGLHGAPDQFASEWYEAVKDQTRSYAGQTIDIADDAIEDAVQETEAAMERMRDNGVIEPGERFAQTIFNACLKAKGLSIDTRKWFAERRNAAEFGQKVAVEATVPLPIKHVDLSELDMAELEQLEAVSDMIQAKQAGAADHATT